MNPFGDDLNVMKLKRIMESPDRLASMLSDELPGSDNSAAEVLADIVNVMRADVRALAGAHDVDVEAERMTEARAADLLAGLTDGEMAALIEVFNEVAAQRDRVLREALDDDEYDQFMQAKTEIMATDDPETWDEGHDQGDVDGGVEDGE